MRKVCLFLLGIMIALSLQSFLGFGKGKDNQAMKELKKKTMIGFTIPYYIRYDPDDWDCFLRDEGQVFEARDKCISITVKVNDEEKNLPYEELVEGFKKNIHDCFSDKSLYENMEFKPEENLIMNGINLLHVSALVHLKPNSVHLESSGRGRYTNLSFGF